MTKPVFISYSTDDSASAEQMRDGLEAASIPCWMAPRDIAPGLEYGSQIVAAIEECAVLVLLLSESSNRSRFVLNEVERAVSKDKIVIPVRIHNVTPSRSLEFFISNAQWIDARQPPLTAHIATLVVAVRSHLTATAPQAQAQGTSDAARLEPAFASQLPANRHSNLPTPSTPFVGRGAELVEVAGHLADPTCRLLTLSGHGGTGKSRLALEIARNILVQGTLAPDGVFFVALETLSAPSQVPFAIARALDLSFASQNDSRDLLLAFLSEKQLLLLLDNFEHLLAGADLVSDILATAPGVKILITSREALNLQEEWFYPVGGLDLPLTQGTVEQTLESGAVQLFTLCALRARPTFDLATEATNVVQLCRLLDGTPLALELAAAWLRSLTCTQIVQELQGSLELLATTMRNVPQRHRSMEAVFEQSWQLLNQSEHIVLCQFSVFEGGFDLVAARAISGVSTALMTRLVESSWVRVSDEGRYDLVPLARSYLLGKLQNDYAGAAGESSERVRDRHCRYYAATLHAMTARQREQELANLRAGWHHALTSFDGESFFGFVTQMLHKLLLRKGWADSYQEAEELMVASERRLRAAMDGQEGVLPTDELLNTLAQLLFQRAVASNRAGLGQKAEALCREGLAALEKLDVKDARDLLRVQALEILSWILIGQSKLQDAETTANQALAECPNGANWEYQVYALHYLAYSREEQGYFAEAMTHLRRALALLPGKRAVDFIDYILVSRLGSASYNMGKYAQAAEWWGKAAKIPQVAPLQQRLEHQVLWARLDRAAGDLMFARTRCLNVLPVAREHGLRLVQVFALSELGCLALLDGAVNEAESYYREAQQIADYIGRRKEAAKAWIGLGNVELARIHFPEATASFCRGLAIVWPVGILPETIAAIIGLARVEIQTGDRQLAMSWLRMAVAHPATSHHIRMEAQALFTSVEENAGGRELGLEEIVSVVLASRGETVVDNTQ